AIEAAARASAGHAPGEAARLPQRREQRVGIPGIEGDVNAAGVRVFVEHFLPGLAAVGGAEDAALFVGAELMAESGNEHVLGVDDDFGDGARVTQPDVLPCLAAVHGLVYAVAVRDVAADAGFAGSGVD